ncbi:Lrp/AsnC ligand binding domain-containing protein [Halobaculum sp. CBA1158]|uniref:Lrp/AsnC family transcriptional regulator n=1 Tax=Halobaculum sp. CBA1158 TaxID=2904243 RepID=UPI001F1E9880|nr:Lrp/AsnC ligand binding domain-containing protein [Halobaculum sp. CBA1158]UIO99404.1 Lrp/AsnC ligand binding domain-containing protein [Halobaculum sp. CBA1158]
MVVAYVMVKATSGDADRIRTAIAGLDGVEEAHIVAGDMDFVVKVDVGGPADVKRVAADGIQAIDGVEDTRTYIAMG